MKKLGFTLAEVLITLMILGVIAAMTVPTLIQDTQKKEQVVQIKKGLSMINQAITMNYALEQTNLLDAYTKGVTTSSGSDDAAKALDGMKGIVTMLTNRMSVVDSGTDWVSTGDGLTYAWGAVNTNCTGSVTSAGANKCFELVISTVPATESTYGTTDGTRAKKTTLFADLKGKLPSSGSGVLTGYYLFYAGQDRVIPSENTQYIMNAQNLKSIKFTDLPNASEGSSGS